MAYTKEGVKYFTNAMQGAPQLSGTVAGNRIQLLDACLKDGFGLLAVTSITVASGIATLTISGGHAYKLWSVLQIAGVTGAMTGLNAQFKLTAVGATTCTFPCPGVPDGTASGSITAKVAPLGWLKPFSGTNLAVYKSADVFANQRLLRVDDTGTTSPRVRAYESMTDVNNGLGLFPTVAQAAGSGGYWPGNTAGSNKIWAIVGDERFFMFFTAGGASLVSGWSTYFGDLIEDTADPFATALYAPAADYNNYGSATIPHDIATMASGFSATSSQNVFVPRNWNGLGGSINIGQASAGHTISAGVSGGTGSGMSFPDPRSFKMLLTPTVVFEAQVLRGLVPGLYGTPMNTLGVAQAFSALQVVSGLDGPLAGRAVLTIPTGFNYSSFNDPGARVFVDIVGPWRT